MSDLGTVIVGAGPAGLAVAACLRQAGRPFVILEQADDVGASWRTRYRRLHLHTAKEHSALPYWPFPGEYPRYPSRDQVVTYLDGYARHFELAPRFGEPVRAARRGADGTWTVATARAEHHARHVVVCTGAAALPFRPTWPGTFSGEVMHSAQYDNGERHAGRKVLVVGVGNSGAEIALDLSEHGAEVDLSARGPIHVVPRDVLGILPIQRSTILLSFLPLAVRDGIGRTVSRLTFGDLPKLGLPRPELGPITLIEQRRRIPLIDVGTIKAVREGKIRLRGNVTALAGNEVRFGEEAGSYDTVILATGYRPQVAALFPDHPAAVEADGFPAGVSHGDLAGLHFVGFGSPATGLLRQMARDARRVARIIVKAS